MLITALFAWLTQIPDDGTDRPRHSVLLERLLDPSHGEALVVSEMVACGDEEVAVVGAELESGVGLAVNAGDDRQRGTHSF
jgi:hypothetical protein